MFRRAVVLRCVAIGRVIAAKGGAALLAGPQVNSRRADLHAFIAHMPLRGCDGGNRIEVRAASSSHISS